MVENPLANAGDTGSSPDLGRSHMPRSNWAREPQLLSLRVWSLCSATREAVNIQVSSSLMYTDHYHWQSKTSETMVYLIVSLSTLGTQSSGVNI